LEAIKLINEINKKIEAAKMETTQEEPKKRKRVNSESNEDLDEPETKKPKRTDATRLSPEPQQHGSIQNLG